MRYRNVTYAFVDSLRDVLAEGKSLAVRGSNIMEMRNRLTVLERPQERCLVTPSRHNNIFATIAETMWVLAGRNDLAFLSRYLPRAQDFSDDGQTWRAAYGPRLRNWHGVDQLRENLTLLRHELSTRRAVMSIFDPAVDFIDSKDIPCNNWIHWLIRDGQLHMNIAVRSNDIMWGFSGINTFYYNRSYWNKPVYNGLQSGTCLSSSLRDNRPYKPSHFVTAVVVLNSLYPKASFIYAVRGLTNVYLVARQWVR
jgi:thymidylate synthase